MVGVTLICSPCNSVYWCRSGVHLFLLQFWPLYVDFLDFQLFHNKFSFGYHFAYLFICIFYFHNHNTCIIADVSDVRIVPSLSITSIWVLEILYYLPMTMKIPFSTPSFPKMWRLTLWFSSLDDTVLFFCIPYDMISIYIRILFLVTKYHSKNWRYIPSSNLWQ